MLWHLADYFDQIRPYVTCSRSQTPAWTRFLEQLWVRRGRSGWGRGIGQQLKSYNSRVDALAPAPEDCSSPALSSLWEWIRAWLFTTIFRSVEVVEGADARLRRSNADNKGEILPCLRSGNLWKAMIQPRFLRTFKNYFLRFSRAPDHFFP